MIYKYLRNILFLMILILIALFPVVYSWFEKTTNHGIIIESGDYQVEMFVYFGTTQLDPNNTAHYDLTKNIILVNAYDDTSLNYIGNLKISLTITAPNLSRFRIRLQDEWQLKRTYKNSDPLLVTQEVLSHERNETIGLLYPFILAPTFTGKLDSQGYLYYTNLLPKQQQVTIDFIAGGNPQPVRDNDTFFEQCYVNLQFFVDVVQANRFSEVWNIDENFFA